MGSGSKTFLGPTHIDYFGSIALSCFFKTLPAGWVGSWLDGISDFNENPVVSPDSDFDLGFVKNTPRKVGLSNFFFVSIEFYHCQLSNGCLGLIGLNWAKMVLITIRVKISNYV